MNKKNNKGIIETYDKISIERWISTEEKVGTIVPKILNVDSPKQRSFWESFKALQKIRDAIIRQKQSLRQPDEIDSSFLGVLLCEKISQKIQGGFQLIQYFCSLKETHIHFPMLSGEIPFDVDIRDSFDDTFH